MDIKAYIESGILEAYLLGALSNEEERQVAADMALFPELEKEMTAIENAMLQYSSSLAVDPPPALQDKIWDALQKGVPAASADPPAQKAPKVIPLTPAYRKPVLWKYAAVWVALAGSLALNMMLWYRGNGEKEEKLALNGKMNRLETEQKQLAQVLGDYQKAKSMMADTAMVTIVMHTMQKGHPMAATLYWSKNKGEAYVAIDGLPAPPQGMQYQLWVMQGGKPVDMGVIANSMANTPAMQRISRAVTNGEAFAISLEKEGGNPTPTMDKIYVMGKA